MVSNNGREILKLLNQRLKSPGSDGVLSGALAAMMYSYISDSELIRSLFREVSFLLVDAVKDGLDVRDPLVLLSRFAEASEAAYGSLDQVAEADGWTSLRKAIHNVIALPLSSLFGHTCRVRIWAMYPEDQTYVGLLTLGMAPAFKKLFEAEYLILSKQNAPYQTLDGSTCLILTADAVSTFLETKADPTEQSKLTSFYLDPSMLGLGKVVAETYTFEFMGESDLISWALSFDSGQNSNSAAAPPCNKIVLRMIEFFLLPLRDVVSKGLGAIASKGSRADQFGQSMSGGLVIRDLPTIAPKSDSVDPVVPLSPAPVLPSSLASSSELLRAPFDCLPSVHRDEGEEFVPIPWVFSKDDPSVARLSNWHEVTRNRRGSGSVTLLGPSGCGKYVIATTITGIERKGKVVQTSWHDPLQALQTVTGGAVATDIPYARAAGVHAMDGVVVYDEAIKAIVDKHEAYSASLLGPVANLNTGQTITEASADPKGKIQKWKANCFVIFTGTLEDVNELREKYLHSNWWRRFNPMIPVPGWCDLSPPSRAVVFRWYVVKELANRQLQKAAIHAALFRNIVEDLRPKVFFDRGNMAAIDTFIRHVADYCDTFNGVLRITLDAYIDYIRDTLKGDAGAIAEAEQCLEESGHYLEIGEGSAYENALSPFDRLVIRMAKCSSHSDAS